MPSVADPGLTETRATRDHGAFVAGPRTTVAATARGPLDGLRFAVKDLFDLAGEVTGAGNPDWRRTHQPAPAHAPVVARLLATGASVCGRTITDELAFSLEGENAHEGTPRNPACPDRLPGGSSSGSAVAVAAGLCDFALGTDTGGSVRIPAAFCGIYGMRPTHDRIPTTGVVPFAPSYDTIGWMHREATGLARVGAALFGGPLPPATTMPVILPEDVFALADPEAAVPARACLNAWCVSGRLRRATPLPALFEGDPGAWHEVYRIVQGDDIRHTLGDWIREVKPRFGENIAPRFASVFALTDAEVRAARTMRARLAARVEALLDGGAWLAIPTSPRLALPRDADGAARGDFYQRALAINAIAGHAGLPQVTIPLPTPVGRPPAAVSLIGPRGADEALLAWVAALAR